MKIKSIILVLGFIASFGVISCYGQTAISGGSSTRISDLILMSNEGKDQSKRYSDIDGSPYSTEDFLPAKIVFKKGNEIEGVMARIDLYEGQLEYQIEGKTMILGNFGDIDYFNINEETYVIRTAANGGVLSPKIFKRLVGGDCELLILESVKFIDERPATNSYSESTPAQFSKEKEKYFLKIGNKDLIEVEANKKKFIELFDQVDDSFSEIVKNNGLNLRKESDLVELVTIYNQI